MTRDIARAPWRGSIPRMQPRRDLAHLALVVVVIGAALGAALGDGGCAGSTGPPRCNNVLDCDVDQACRDGVCGDNDSDTGEGEGEGEGDEPVDDGAAVRAACAVLGNCQSLDPSTCQSQLAQQLDSMRASADLDCQSGADSLARVFQCIGGTSCAVVQGNLEAACPGFNAAENLAGECQSIGVGEGEGEGEGQSACPSGPLPVGGASILIEDASATAQTSNATCALAVTFTILVAGDASGVSGGEVSFDGINTVPLDDVTGSADGTVTASACSDVNFGSFALVLFVDGSPGNIFCGSL
ncbi:MAG TPA: hypothetical protein VGO62_15050 [Myxococcota bacterium]